MLRFDTIRDTEIMELAMTMWREARGEGAQGMLAVGCVIRNRKLRWGGSFWQQVTARNQFSAMTYLGDSQTIKWPSPVDSAWHEAIELAKSIYLGSVADATGGAIYYHNPRASTPGGWFERNIVGQPSKFKRTATIGRHEFYAEVEPA